MTRALELASYGLYTTYPNPAVGCVFVRDGKIIGEGYHHRAGEPHAEIMALNAAGDVRGATAYVSLEPCSHYGRTPPCALRLCQEHVARVVVASGDPNPKVSGRGIAMLREAGIDVTEHVLEEQACYLNRAFFKGITKKQPYVTLKVGMSLDGKTALSDGRSKWITSAEARLQVQDIRAKCDVIVTGSGTVQADDPRLNVRYGELPERVRDFLPEDKLRQPLKVVMDTRGRLDVEKYQIFSEGRVLWCTAGAEAFTEEILNEHVTRLYLPVAPEGHLDFGALLEYLGAREYRRVMVEAGAGLTATVVSSYADELYVFMSPKILGATARGAFAIDEVHDLDEADRYMLHSVRTCGSDVRLHYLRHFI